MPRMRAKACIAALPAILNSQMVERSYRAYITDSLGVIGENTAKSVGGAYIQSRWIDLLEPWRVDIRSGAEIAADVIEKSGLKIKQKGNTPA